MIVFNEVTGGGVRAGLVGVVQRLLPLAGHSRAPSCPGTWAPVVSCMLCPTHGTHFALVLETVHVDDTASLTFW